MSRKAQPPRKPQRLVSVYETLTSHDGTPCTIAWSRTSLAPNRPPASLQIYNTTPSSASNDQENAESLYAAPLEVTGEVHFRERLDIYGLAMDTNVSEDERIARCIAHQRVEISDREANGRQDLHMMCWHWGTYEYKRFILVVDNKTADWQDGEMLFVWFDPVQTPADVDGHLPEIRVKRFQGLEELCTQLRFVRSAFGFQSAVDRGEFDDEYSRQNCSNWGDLLKIEAANIGFQNSFGAPLSYNSTG